jgi:hypothetical protein
LFLFQAVKIRENGHYFFPMIVRDHEERMWYMWVYFTGPPAEAKKYMMELVIMDAGMEPLVIHREAVVPLEVTYDDVRIRFIF